MLHHTRLRFTPHRTLPPQILTIGATGALDPALRAAGGSVRSTSSLRDAYAQVVQAQPAPPTLLLINLQTIDPTIRALTAPKLVALLAGRMRQGSLPLAWLVGLIDEADPDLEAEASLAGCHITLHAPLRDNVPAELVRLAQKRALVPPHDRATLAYQRAAAGVWQVIQTRHAVEVPA